MHCSDHFSTTEYWQVLLGIVNFVFPLAVLYCLVLKSPDTELSQVHGGRRKICYLVLIFSLAYSSA